MCLARLKMCLAQFCGVVSWSRFAQIFLISVADSEGSGRRSLVCCTWKVQSVRQQISTKRASNNGDAASTTCVRTSSRSSGTIAGFASISLLISLVCTRNTEEWIRVCFSISASFSFSS
jgi:hypothetical protein